jgi:hypothetical protein
MYQSGRPSQAHLGTTDEITFITKKTMDRQHFFICLETTVDADKKKNTLGHWIMAVASEWSDPNI